MQPLSNENARELLLILMRRERPGTHSSLSMACRGGATLTRRPGARAQHMRVAAAFLSQVASTLPSIACTAVAQLAVADVLQVGCDPQAAAVFEAYQGWVWPELAAVSTRHYGPFAVALPLDPEIAAVVRLLVTAYTRETGQSQRDHLRDIMLSLGAVQVKGHIHHLLAQTKRRLKAFEALHVLAPEGHPAEYLRAIADALPRRREVEDVRMLLDQVDNEFETYGMHAGASVERVRLAAELAKSAVSFLAARTPSVWQVGKEAGNLLTPQLEVVNPCCCAHAGRTLQPAAERSLPPFSPTCECAGVRWWWPTGWLNEFPFFRETDAFELAPRALLPLRLWTLAWLVDAHTKPRLPAPLLLEVVGAPTATTWDWTLNRAWAGPTRAANLRRVGFVGGPKLERSQRELEKLLTCDGQLASRRLNAKALPRRASSQRPGMPSTP